MSKKLAHKTVHLTLDENTQLEAIALADDRSCSDILHEAMTDYLDRRCGSALKIAHALGYRHSTEGALRTGRADGSEG